MDQEKEIEKIQVTDFAVLKEYVPSAIATGNTSGKPEKVEESSEAPNNAPSSADKAMEQPPFDKPQDQPTAGEPPNQPSDDVHYTKRPSSEKQLSSENTPDTGKTEDQPQDDQTANQPPTTCDDKPEKDLQKVHIEDEQSLGDESSTKETDLNPAPITQGAEEQKPTGQKSEEGQHSVTSKQDPNANDQVSSSQTGTPPEQLKSGVQEVHIEDEPSAKATEDPDSAASNSADSNDKTEEQSTQQNVKEIGESSVKVEDSAAAEPLMEAPSKQPLKSGKDLQPLGDESSTKETDLNPAPLTQRAEEQKPTGQKSEEGQHSVTSEQDPNANDQVSSSKIGTPPEKLKSGVQENTQDDTAASTKSSPQQEGREGSFYHDVWDAILAPENCVLMLLCLLALWIIFWASSFSNVAYTFGFNVVVIMIHVLLRLWIKGAL